MTPFERIISRLVKELLDDPKCIAEFDEAFEKARRDKDTAKMHLIGEEARAYRRRIDFVKSLLKELTK